MQRFYQQLVAQDELRALLILTTANRWTGTQKTHLAVMPTPHRFSCRISTFDMDVNKEHSLGPSVAACTRSGREMQDLVSLCLWMHMCFCGSGAHSRLPNDWIALPAAAGLHNDRGRHLEYCFFSLSTSVVRQQPRRRPARVPLLTS
ncbi:hypothetical protein M3J09_006700 [Ascochyta lentis]